MSASAPENAKSAQRWSFWAIENTEKGVSTLLELAAHAVFKKTTASNLILSYVRSLQATNPF